MRRIPTSWNTRFGRWVSEVTVSRIVHELGASPATSVTQDAVYHWLNGRHIPSPQRAIAMAELSEGKITLEDIYSQRQEIESQKAT